MSTHYIWLNSNPESQRQLREASETRAAAFYAAWKAAVRAVADPVREVGERIRRASRVRRTYRELSALSDHHLRDIGLVRGEIAGIADTVAGASPEVGLTLAELRQARSAPSFGGESRVAPLPQADRQQRDAPPRAARRPTDATADSERAAA